MAKKDDGGEKKQGRLKQIRSAYKMTRKQDPKIGLVLAGIFLGVAALFALLAVFLGPWWIWATIGFPIASGAAIDLADRMSAAFHGAIAPTTPTGRRIPMANVPGTSDGITVPIGW
jgi:hypothetical protein